MKRRSIVILVVVVLVLLYQNNLKEASEFGINDLNEFRNNHKILYTHTEDNNLLVFSQSNKTFGEDQSLTFDYFKPGLTKWNWINGGMHSGNYDHVTYQYLPKKYLKDFAISFGLVVNPDINEINLVSPDSTYKARILELEDNKIWYVISKKDTKELTLIFLNKDGMVINEHVIDNTWLVD